MASHYALITAAGTGSRLGGAMPKQYVSLLGKPMLRYSIERFASEARIMKLYVALAATDTWWREYEWTTFSEKLVPLFCGGATRAQTVKNALEILEDVQEDDWLLVHDAARPCLSAAQLDKLLRELASDPVGGLLAVPVADTLKRADASGRAAATAPREGLWQAQTPQMFRFAPLKQAMRAADLDRVTDEAQAIEQLGMRARLVRGDSSNLKVTYAEDLALAAAILRSRDD
jgi:2-C-methyl-D-erythritol 4-phosphate cytidylyltransferase